MYNKELSFTVTFMDGTNQRFSTLVDIDCPILATQFLVRKLAVMIQEYHPNKPVKQIKSISLNIDVI